MKRKNFFARLCTLALIFAFAFSAFNLAPVAKEAKAADPATMLDLSLVAGNIPSTVSYGDEIAIPSGAAAVYDVTLYKPNKETLAITDSVTTVKVDQLGHYVVRFADKNDPSVYYEYRIYSELNDEVKLVVENEADIPTNVATGTKKKLPAAYVAVVDEDGKLVKVDGSESTIKVSTDTVANVDLTADYEYATAGTTFVTYSAQYLGGTKYLSKTYEVKVQDDFTDTKAPTLSVSGVPSTANVKKAVTLPVATASDSLDGNVKVEIKVTTLNAAGTEVAVKEVTVDEENDKALTELTTDVKFDNAENMTFYPFTEGEYKVSYQAVDDNGNKSASWNYTITVSDKKAPTMTIDETKIPAKWGYNKVTLLTDNDESNETKVTLTGDQLKLHFDVPAVVDNKDEASDVKISFSIKDAESATILNFTNINQGQGATGTTTTSATLGSLTFNNVNGFDFDISKYVSAKREADSSYLVAGNYVVTYTASDAENNRSTKTYTIAISETFEDSSKVTVKFDDVVEYVVANEAKATEFIVPTPTYASTTDSKLTLEYTIGNGSDTVAVKGGEEAEIKFEESKYNLYIDGVKAFEVNAADDIVLSANAVSDAGNKLTSAATETIDLIVPSTTALFNDVNATLIAGTEFDAAQEYFLGDVNIELTDASVRNQVGIELGVRDSEGTYLSNVTAVVYSDSDFANLIARDVKVETSASGTFYLEVAAFDISGNRKVKVIPFVIKAPETDSGTEELSTSVTATDVNSTFMLNGSYKVNVNEIKSTLINPDGSFYAVLTRTINGGKFALMGDEFTALTTGNYSIKNGADLVDGSDVTARYEFDNENLNNCLAGLAKTESIVTVSDTSAVQFELQGVLPTYANGIDVTLPKAIAYSDNANADEIKVEVKLNGEEVILDTDAQDNKFFKAEANGTYTVIYTVKAAGEASTFEYSIRSGDVVMPTFTLIKGEGEGSHASSVKVGHGFEFLKISATDNKSTAANLTYKKTVIGPDGETYGGTINAKGETSGANKTIPSSGKFTLDEAGKYTVRYEVIDEAGNSAVKEFEITVTGESSGGGISLAALSTILIIVGVLLIAGVVVYLFRFRKVKKSDNK